MSTTTRDLGEVAASLAHVAYLLTTARDTIGELPVEVDVSVSILGPFHGDRVACMALVEQLAAVTGEPPAWDPGTGERRWYRTQVRGNDEPWTLSCSVLAEHPDGGLAAENERLRAKLAEIEAATPCPTGEHVNPAPMVAAEHDAEVRA